MTQISFKSAGVSARVINLTGPTSIQPTGIPAGVIGTSEKGPAFVPVTVATAQDFVVDFGQPTNEYNHGPLGAIEWLRNAQSLTYLKVLGIGSGQQRETSGNNTGRVNNAGFVVGAQLPQSPNGALGNNSYAGSGGVEGRVYFLGCYMAESGSSTIFQDASQPTSGTPLVRGVLMAASGVLLTLSSSNGATNTVSAVGTEALAGGFLTGALDISNGRQEFTMLLNGHVNTDPTYPNSIKVSFDPSAKNYLTNVLNTNPLKMEEAGYYLYSDFRISPAMAVPTGSGIINDDFGAGAASGSASTEEIAFLLTSSLGRNAGSSTVPSYENFEDRYKTAESVWVTSQKFGGAPENLFKISALSDGAYPVDRMKFSIENITPGTDASPYGTFDLIVRSFNDTDKTKVVLEAWRGLSLDPTAPTYIARIIGDTKTFFNFDAQEGRQKLVTQGLFENKSRYIRVEMADKVRDGNLDSSALPFGFRGAPHFVTSGSAPMPAHTDSTILASTNPFHDLVQVPVPFRENLAIGVSPSKVADTGLYWGVQFTDKTSVSEPNGNTAVETNILSFAKYYPNFQTNWINFVASNNEGTADTAENGVLDADRFNNNGFTLGNVKIGLNSAGNPDTQRIYDWQYIRAGNVSTTSTFRPLNVTDLKDSSVRNAAKFSFFIHGGYDGNNIFNEDMSNMTNRAIVEEMNSVSRGTANGPVVSAFGKAIDLISDQTEVDIQLLAIPGIRHEVITDKALLTIEDRFDAMFLMDIDEYDIQNNLVTSSNQIVSVNNTTTNFRNRGLNSSFGAAYFPDVVITDTVTGTTRIVPPSVATLGAFSKNDSVGYPWFAPAGFTRGALETTERSATVLNRTDMDSLQTVDINPIVSFAGSDGNVIWGQKTLLATDSSLERVNVRRLLVDVRRKVADIARKMLFEPNRESTLNRFTQLVRPVLKRIQDQKGVDRFLIKIDTTTTTEADIQNRTIRGKIFLQPTRTLEFLSVDFVVTNEEG
jgi:hypothetical protein